MGIQQRDIYCQLKDLGQVNEAMCNRDTRPASKRQCQLPACVQYQWSADEWEDVSRDFNLCEVTERCHNLWGGFQLGPVSNSCCVAD